MSMSVRTRSSRLSGLLLSVTRSTSGSSTRARSSWPASYAGTGAAGLDVRAIDHVGHGKRQLGQELDVRLRQRDLQGRVVAHLHAGQLGGLALESLGEAQDVAQIGRGGGRLVRRVGGPLQAELDVGGADLAPVVEAGA